MDWELGVDRCRLLPLEWISDEILLRSPANYVWSLVVEDKVRKRMCTCMWGWVTLLCGRKLTERREPAMMEKIKII